MYATKAKNSRAIPKLIIPRGFLHPSLTQCQYPWPYLRRAFSPSFFRCVFIPEVAMIARSAPLLICLLWLAYESHFSPQFFAATMRTSVSSIMSGIDDAMATPHPGFVKTAADDSAH
jgi:hypothetical protein